MNELPQTAASVAAGGTGTAAPATRQADAKQDPVDLRDRYYSPTLQVLRNTMLPSVAVRVLSQGEEGGCTGFALAAAIHMFRQHRAEREWNGRDLDPATQARLAEETAPVSARMLYQMAKLHDELPDLGQEGATLRGALKGFYHNGVCSAALAPWRAGETWDLDITCSKDARKISLGAYYRLRPLMSEYHAALSETGAVIVSAKIHDGWYDDAMTFDADLPAERRPAGQGIITQSKNPRGGHAFVVIGYDQAGFLIQNSWDERWGGFGGRAAVAHWSYEDWAENIMDAWVLQLGVPTPTAFHLTHTLVRPNYTIKESGGSAAQARRQDVIGHLIHLDDGMLLEKGRYGTPIESLRETGDYLAGVRKKQDETQKNAKSGGEEPPKPASEKYDHILFFAHGSLAGPEVGARRTAVMRDVFKRNRVYPIHIMWETGISDTVYETLEAIYKRAQDRVGDRQDELDKVIELMARGLGTKVWRAIKADAHRAFARAGKTDPSAGTGYDAIHAITRRLDRVPGGKKYKIHVVGHSAGATLIGECLRRWTADKPQLQIENCFLLAPACTLAFYDKHFLPLLLPGEAGESRLRRIVQYSLSDRLETADVLGHYGKSTLNLVSRAFEDTPGTAMLGLQKSLAPAAWQQVTASHWQLPKKLGAHDIYFSEGDLHPLPTTATSHNGFVSDLPTLNDMLTTILGGPPDKPFTAADLVGL